MEIPLMASPNHHRNTGDTLRVAVPMLKGGTGKTTTSINVAGALNPRGNDVLLVDADSQGSATEYLGLEDQYTLDRTTLSELMLDQERIHEVESLIVDHEEMDVIPAHLDDFQIGMRIIEKSRRDERLKFLLDEIDTDYDVIIIDTAPGIRPLSNNALVAAENAIFPVQPEQYAVSSLNWFFDHISAIDDAFAIDISVLAAVINKIGEHGISDSMHEWMYETFGEDLCFEIPNWVVIQYAFEENNSIFEHEPMYHNREHAKTLQRRYTDMAEHVERYYE